MDVSKNRGTPKWMVYFMENPVKMGDLRVPLLLETPICEEFFVWRNDMCFVIKQKTSVWTTANVQKHTHTKQALFGWNSPSMSMVYMYSCILSSNHFKCIPIKCNTHNAFKLKLSSSPHFFYQSQTLTFLSQFPQDICPLLRFPTNWHGGLDMFIGLKTWLDGWCSLCLSRL